MEIINDAVQYYNGEFKKYNYLYQETKDHFAPAIGRVIVSAKVIGGDELVISFTDGTAIKLYDGGQSCCEHRYMDCADDLTFAEGATLLGGCIKDCESVDGGYNVHDIQFLEIVTSKGSFTVHSHNEHNGYYGGFSISCVEV